MREKEISDFYLSLNDEQKRIVRGISRIFLNADMKQKLMEKLFSSDYIKNNNLSQKTLDFIEKHKFTTIEDMEMFGMDKMAQLTGSTPEIIEELKNLIKIYNEKR
ncbi:MAG: hypothetical protein WAT79_08535 [Saprospiraceae bacterium]